MNLGTKVFLALATSVAVISSDAQGVFVGRTEVKIENGIADFGKGTHTNGAPTAFALVNWDFTPNAAGDVVVRATVDGTLYLDTCLGGSVAVKIEYFSSQSGANPLDDEIIPLSAGIDLIGCANASSHKRTVSHFFSSPFLRQVRITVGKFSSQQVVDGKAKSAFSPDLKIFPQVSINNTPPTLSSGTVSFERIDNFVHGFVGGKVFWNGTPAGRARIHVQFLDVNNNLLQSFATESTLTSAPSTNNVNFRTTPQVVRGKLFRIRVLLGTGVTINGQPFLLNFVERFFDLAGGTSPGTFELTPSELAVSTLARTSLAFTWTVPDPQVWPHLDSMRLRIRDGSDVVLSLLFDEETRTLALVDETSGKLDRAYPAGENRKLIAPHAVIYLKDCRLITDGPQSPTVTLLLNLSFKSSLAGSSLAIDVSASDDEGNHGAFEPAGSITVY